MDVITVIRQPDRLVPGDSLNVQVSPILDRSPQVHSMDQPLYHQLNHSVVEAIFKKKNVLFSQNNKFIDLQKNIENFNFLTGMPAGRNRSMLFIGIIKQSRSNVDNDMGSVLVRSDLLPKLTIIGKFK